MSKVRTIGAVILVFLLAIFLITACGNNLGTENNQNDQEGRNNNEQRSANVKYYDSDKGRIEIPETPSRVVVAVRDYVGDVLAAGIQPVGISEMMVLEAPYYEQYLEGVEGIGDGNDVSLEKIMTLEPDLIFTYSEESYEQLSKIASTVYIPYGKLDFEERLLEFGKILNREAEVQQRLDQFKQKVKQKKEQLDEKLDSDTTVAIIEITDKELYVFGKTYGRGGEVLYNQLGLSQPEKIEQATAEDGWASISLEMLPEFLGEADYILMGVRETGISQKKEIQESPLWTGLTAVRKNRVYEYDLVEFYFQDVLALDYQLDVLSAFLLSH